MAEAKSVPVLFVSDPVVLPGMVVPIALDDAARAADDRAVMTSHSDEGSGFVDGACQRCC